MGHILGLLRSERKSHPNLMKAKGGVGALDNHQIFFREWFQYHQW